MPGIRNKIMSMFVHFFFTPNKRRTNYNNNGKTRKRAIGELSNMQSYSIYIKF